MGERPSAGNQMRLDAGDEAYEMHLVVEQVMALGLVVAPDDEPEHAVEVLALYEYSIAAAREYTGGRQMSSERRIFYAKA